MEKHLSRKFPCFGNEPPLVVDNVSVKHNSAPISYQEHQKYVQSLQSGDTKKKCEYCVQSIDTKNISRHTSSCYLKNDRARSLEIILKKKVNIPTDKCVCRFCNIIFKRSDYRKKHNNICKSRSEYIEKLEKEVDNKMNSNAIVGAPPSDINHGNNIVGTPLSDTTSAMSIPYLRKKFTPSQRYEIAFNQAAKCRTCSDVLKENFHIDHIVPLHVGGSNTIENVQALCLDCHANKTKHETRQRISSKNKIERTETVTS